MTNNKNIVLVSVLGAILVITMLTTGSINSAYASHKSVKVGCKDVAFTLITYAQLLSLADSEDIADFEDTLDDEDIKGIGYQEIIDKHVEDLLDEAEDECKKLPQPIKEFLEDIEFNLP